MIVPATTLTFIPLIVPLPAEGAAFGSLGRGPRAFALPDPAGAFSEARPGYRDRPPSKDDLVQASPAELRGPDRRVARPRYSVRRIPRARRDRRARGRRWD